MRRLFRQFSFPGGIPSHVAPETPGSIHEGGELGYALSHAYGAAFDNPDLLVAAVVGDGEAETGALATSWHSNKFVNPAKDGVVLPILHLNGYKIANPTVLARIPEDELRSLMIGYGHKPHFFEVADDAEPRPTITPTRTAGSRRCSTRCSTRSPRSRPRRSPATTTAAGVADDRLPHPEGLDRPGLHRRQEDHRIVARAPGSAGQRPRHPRAPPGARGLAGVLPRRGTVRRERHARPGHRRPGARGHAADERQPARQRRPAAQGSAAARLPRLRASTCPRPARRWPRPPRCSAAGSPT